MSFGEDVAALVEASDDPVLAKSPRWERIALGDIASILNGYPWKSEHFTKFDGVPLIRIRDVTTGDTETRYSGPVVDGFWVEDGDLLVGMDGDFNVRRWRSERGLLNQRVCKVTVDPAAYDNQLLEYALPGYLRLINKMTSSVTVKHLSSRTLAEIPLPLPPLPEQRRIVAKLDALAARLARARAELDRVPVLADQLRQAALDELFSSAIGEQVTLSELGRWSSGGTPKSSEPSYYGGEIPWIRSGDLPDGPIDQHFVTITDRGLQASSAKWVPTGAVLIAMYGATIGKLGITTYPVTTNQAVACIVPAESVDPLWLFYLLLQKRPQLISLGQGGAQPNVSQQILKAIRTIRPSLDYQQTVAAELNASFAHADRVEAEAARARALLDRLEAAILARAFRGDLVPQQPNDEPASTLLERIRKQRVEEPTPRHRRKNTSDAQAMTATPTSASDRLLKDSQTWPETGVRYEEVAKRITLPHDEIRDALYELLSGPEPVLRQVFDKAGEQMMLQRIAE